MRLINVVPMLEQLELEHYDKDWYVSQYNADWISSWLDSQPIIDAEPVKHGRWKLYGNDDDIGCSYFCSCCIKGNYDEDWFYIHSKFTPFNYCPNCGAKMDLEET